MTRAAVGPVEEFAFAQRLAWHIHLDRRFGWAAMTERRNLQFRSPADGERKNPAKPGFYAAPFWNVEQARHSSPPGHNRDVLHSIHHVGHRRGQDSCSGVELPELLSIGCAIRQENSVGTALKDEIPRRGKHSARLHAWMGYVPNLAFFHWVPGNKLAHGSRSCQRFFQQRALVARIVSHVPRRRIKFPAWTGGVHVDCSFLGRHVNESKRWVKGHGVPVVRSARVGRNEHGMQTVVPCCRLDRAAALRIDSRSPGNPIDKRICRNELASFPIQHIEETILRGLHNDLAAAAIHLQIRKHERLSCVVVPVFPRRNLKMPYKFTVGGTERENGSKVQVVAFTFTAQCAVPSSSISSAGVNQIELGVVDNRVPGRASTATDPPLAMPCFGRALERFGFKSTRRIPWDRIGAPRQLAGLRVVSGNISTHTELRASVSDEHHSLCNAGGSRNRISLGLIDREDVPDDGA